MFGLDWTEIALIGVVALIAIGPKDLPVAIKTLAGFVKKARRMAGEFQGHVDEMVREANLHEVRDQISQLRGFDIKSEIEKAIDGDGSMRSAFNENPMAPQLPAALPEAVVAEHPVPPPAAIEAPAFVPPTADIVAPYVPVSEPMRMPAFVPPALASSNPSAEAFHEPHRAE